MKRVFTKNQILKSLMLLAFAMISNGMMAQYQLEVNAPASVAGNTYQIFLAGFGDVSGSETTGDVAVSENADGCTIGGGVTGTSGKIAFIDRGDCSFIEKCNNAMNDGVVAVVVCTPNDTLLTMGGTDDASSITVPCVMMRGSDCDVLKVEIANGLNISLKQNDDCDLSGVTYPSNVIWGSNTGEGDFNGGLNGWEMDRATDGWKWTTRGQIDSGAYSSTPFADQSMTWCNGVMVFDSDYLDNLGVQNGTGGACRPSLQPGGFCDGYITSPIMDISGATDLEGVTLQFTQTTDQFQSEYYVIYSIDGGSTWADTIEVNADVAARTSNNPNAPGLRGERTQIPLAVPAGATEIKVRFWYRGNYYYWAIDDVMLLNDVTADLAPSQDWFARYAYYEVPASQVDEIVFMADVDNKGNVDVLNSHLDVQVFGPGTELIHEASLDYGTFPAASAIDNQVFPETYQVPAKEGEYKVYYDMKGDGENTPENNKLSYNFHVTKDKFTKFPSDLSIGGTASFSTYYSFGSIYHFPNATNGETFAAGTTFELIFNGGVTNYSGFAHVHLYKWFDLDGDGHIAAEGEKQLLGESTDIFVANDNYSSGGDLYEVEFEEVSENSLFLEGEATYVIVVSLAPGDEDVAADKTYFLSSGRSASVDYNYFATAYAFNALSITKRHAVLGGGEDDSDFGERFLSSENLGATPRLPLFLKGIVGTEDLNNSIQATIFPNPVKDEVAITLNLGSVSKNVNIELVNLEGKVISTNNFSNVKNNTLKIDATNLATGVYIANIRTNEGFISKRVVVQK